MAYSYSTPKKVYRKKFNNKKFIIKLGIEPIYRMYTSNKYYTDYTYDPTLLPAGSVRICVRSYTEFRKKRFTYRWQCTFIGRQGSSYGIPKSTKIIKNREYVQPKYKKGKYIGRMEQKWTHW